QRQFAYFTPIYFSINDPATTEIYTLSLHDALPIYHLRQKLSGLPHEWITLEILVLARRLPYEHQARFRIPYPEDDDLQGYPFVGDRKSTRLNSSHRTISYAVFCLKKKNSLRWRTY